MADFDRESMLEMFVYEMNQLIENLEGRVLKAETGFEKDDINEIFRIMHTIKGSAAMMLFDSISTTAHAIEDMFYYLREENVKNVNSEMIADVVLNSMDFIKSEMSKIQSGEPADGSNENILVNIKKVLGVLKGEVEEISESVENTVTSQPLDSKKSAEEKNIINQHITEEDRRFNKIRVDNKNVFEINFQLIHNCEMKNIRAYTTVSNLELTYDDVTYYPDNMLDPSALDIIEKNGFQVVITTSEDCTKVLETIFSTTYTDYVVLREAVMGDPNEILDELNMYDINVIFEDGYGIDNKNILNNIKVLEMDSDYIVLNKIEVEGQGERELSLRIYSPMTEDVVRKKVSSFENLKDFEINSNFGTTSEKNVETPVIKEIRDVEETVVDEQAPQVTKIEEIPVIEEIATEVSMPMEQEEVSPDYSKGDVGGKIDIQPQKTAEIKKNAPNQVISVGINKLDQLLNLMGELVIAEAMVTQNPELESLELESFFKDARQLHKIINDVQDIVMSMRMVPLSSVFFKMHRIVRDMSKQLNKEIQLEVIGEETEVDKNIIEHISDPLMHMIRNSIDHGIESENVRLANGKPAKGTVTLEAKNSGGDVLIIIKDDGGGIDVNRVMQKAKNNRMLTKSENEYTEKEIQQFIFQPGFSTNENVTNYSGRGVGMDVVITNLQMVGGSVDVSSKVGVGSEFTLKIPLTLAIIEGMIINLGNANYTIPIISIRQSFKAKKEMISVDPSGNEMITVRGEVYNLIRLGDFFGVETNVSDIEDGIIMVVENGNKTLCLFIDSLVGERQVVVKSMPKYINPIRGISGCTLLGNGDISLIIDVAGFFNK